MWICVAFLNPTISFLSMCVLPLSEIRGYPLNSDGSPQNNNLLKQMARQSWIGNIVSFDAFMVLAGSVLTAYVGVTGLAKRMALDRWYTLLMFKILLFYMHLQYKKYIVMFFKFCIHSILISFYF